MMAKLLARRPLPILAQIWDFIDARDIDKHIVAIATLYISIEIVRWSTGFAQNSPRPGLDIAAILGAINAPLMAMQSVTIKWYFDSRPTDPYKPPAPEPEPDPK
jgi:hypothetical protein